MAKKASVGQVRAWAKQQGFQLGDRGRLPAEVWDAWNATNGSTAVPQQRVSEPEPDTATLEDLEEAHSRIDHLEKLVTELTTRLNKIESRQAEPRRLFARSR